MALVLGAGVSMPFGLPSWDALIDRLYKSAHAKAPRTDAKRQVEHFRDKFCVGSDAKLIEHVRRALYREATLDPDALRQNPTLAAIAALVTIARHFGTAPVVTLNYDDLLERLLEYHGIVTDSVGEPVHWSSAAEAVVYHPHGLIPTRNGVQPSTRIVLDQLSYAAFRGSELWWEEVRTLLRTHFCLFIGLSGRDDNLDSWLVECRERHAANIRPALTYWGVSFTLKNDPVTADAWRRRGIFCKLVANYENALPSLLFRIVQEVGRRVRQRPLDPLPQPNRHRKTASAKARNDR